MNRLARCQASQPWKSCRTASGYPLGRKSDRRRVPMPPSPPSPWSRSFTESKEVQTLVLLFHTVHFLRPSRTCVEAGVAGLLPWAPGRGTDTGGIGAWDRPGQPCRVPPARPPADPKSCARDDDKPPSSSGNRLVIPGEPREAKIHNLLQ